MHLIYSELYVRWLHKLCLLIVITYLRGRYYNLLLFYKWGNWGSCLVQCQAARKWQSQGWKADLCNSKALIPSPGCPLAEPTLTLRWITNRTPQLLLDKYSVWGASGSNTSAEVTSFAPNWAENSVQAGGSGKPRNTPATTEGRHSLSKNTSRCRCLWGHWLRTHHSHYVGMGSPYLFHWIPTTDLGCRLGSWLSLDRWGLSRQDSHSTAKEVNSSGSHNEQEAGLELSPYIHLLWDQEPKSHIQWFPPPTPTIYSPTHPFIPPSIHPFNLPCPQPSIHPSIDPSIYPLSDILSILPSIYLYNQSLTHLFSIMTDVVRDIGKVKELWKAC